MLSCQAVVATHGAEAAEALEGMAAAEESRVGSKRRGCCASGVGVSVGVAVSVGSGVSVCVGRSKYALKYIFGVSFATPLAPH